MNDTQTMARLKLVLTLHKTGKQGRKELLAAKSPEEREDLALIAETLGLAKLAGKIKSPVS